VESHAEFLRVVTLDEEPVHDEHDDSC